jgi:hypothetical protein
MRALIPTDVYKLSVQGMTQQGIPEGIAQRIISNKALWLITMHPDDISKVIFLTESHHSSLQ